MGSAGLTYEALNNLDVWQQMPTITLDEMRGVKLMNRIDTKYVLSESEVLRLIDGLRAEGYSVQLIGDVRACRYDTLYYDTASRDMYIAHHNQQLTRQKIRTRTYIETGISFLEIKNKVFNAFDVIVYCFVKCGCCSCIESSAKRYSDFFCISLRFLRRTRLMCRSKSPLSISSASTYCMKVGTVQE